MADLSDLQSAQNIKISGASSAGSETNFVNSSANGDLQTVDRANTSGVNGAISVSTTAVAAQVGGSNLTERKTLIIYNNSNNTIYWGYSSGVTTANGIPVYKDQYFTWDGLGPNVTIWLIAASGTNDVRVAESA